MLKITQPAAARLRTLLGDSTAGNAVRIVTLNHKLKLRRDHVRNRDTEFKHEGRIVLVLDVRMSRALGSRTLDVRQTDAGLRLRLDPK